MRTAEPARTGSPRGRRFDALLLVAAFATAIGIVVGFFGSVLPLFDTLGQFRAHAAAALVPLGLALAVRRFFAAGFACVLTAVLGLQAVAPFMRTADAPALKLPAELRRYTLLQMNLRYDAEDKATTLKRIAELRPDVVTVQEMTGEWSDAFATIRDAYPYQSYCAPPEYEGDVAILSRRPFVDSGPAVCDLSASFTARAVDFDGKVVLVGSQHLRWPWPGRQWRQIARVVPILSGLSGPKLIGGDFNSAPWSASLARYTAASETAVVAGIGPTYGPNWLPSAVARHAGLPIDNILASHEVVVLSVDRPEATASDHLPVLVTFALPFLRANEPRVESVAR